MMILFDRQLQTEYAANDLILDHIEGLKQPLDETFASHNWLLESLAKRMIYYYLYGDLLKPSNTPKRILDVGGGYSGLTRLLLKNHNYTLLDIMVHDNHDTLCALEKTLGQTFWVNADWLHYLPDQFYDVIIANDLFPNVDQRLAEFLEKYLPACQEMRLLLTYYNTPRTYKVKRLDGEEIFHILAWDGVQVKRVLEPYERYIKMPNLALLLTNPPSLYANQRQICQITLRGKRVN